MTVGSADQLRDPACGFDSFKQFLKTIIFSQLFTNVTSVLEVFLNVMRYINPRFTYLLTYHTADGLTKYVNTLDHHGHVMYVM